MYNINRVFNSFTNKMCYLGILDFRVIFSLITSHDKALFHILVRKLDTVPMCYSKRKCITPDSCSSVVHLILFECVTLRLSCVNALHLWSNTFEQGKNFKPLTYLLFVINTNGHVYRFVRFNKLQLNNRDLLGSLTLARITNR